MVVALRRDFESISCTNLVLPHDAPQKAGGGVGVMLDTGWLCSAASMASKGSSAAFEPL